MPSDFFITVFFFPNCIGIGFIIIREMLNLLVFRLWLLFYIMADFGFYTIADFGFYYITDKNIFLNLLTQHYKLVHLHTLFLFTFLFSHNTFLISLCHTYGTFNAYVSHLCGFSFPISHLCFCFSSNKKASFLLFWQFHPNFTSCDGPV